jgi:macrolide transport system ATP-binding/permease protein
MEILREVWYRVSARRRRASLERQLDEEMQFHRDMLSRDSRASGMSAGAADDAARRQFGNALSLRERSADWWGFPSLEGVLQDVRYAGRMLRRSPGFTAIAVGALGVAIGINSGFFTLIDAFMWRPIPVVNPSRLVKLIIVDARKWDNIRFSYPEYTTIASRSTTLEDVVAYDARQVALRVTGSAGNATAGSAGCVSGNYFSALGGTAAAGRVPTPLDDRAGALPVAVLSDGFWQRAFAGSPDGVGRDVAINGGHATIVGVVRPDFIGVYPLVPDVWMPLAACAQLGVTPGRLLDPANRFISIRGRLRTGVGISQAEAELSGIVREPPAARGTVAELTRITGVRLMKNESVVPFNAETALVAAPGMLIVGLVLVIACANLANLLLARALRRQREIAVRLSLGASRRRVLRQLLTESLVIALLGAALGLLLSNWTVTAVSRSLFAALPISLGRLSFTLHPSWRVLVYTAGLGAASALVFGLAPALQATAPNLTSALKGEDSLFGTRLRRSRFRDALISIQVAACLVLLVAAGTFVRTLREFAGVDTGLELQGVTVARLGLSAADHVPPALTAARARFAARVAALPGVTATARVTSPPLTSWPLMHVAAAGDRGPLQGLPSTAVTPRYFDVVGQRILDGRSFSQDDSGGNALVAIVTAAAARTLWPGKPPLGQLLRVASSSDAADRIVRVVGVVANAHSVSMWDDDSRGYVYLPASAVDLASLEMPLLVRADATGPDLPRAVAAIAREVDPNAPLRIDRLRHLYGEQIVPYRYVAMIAAGIGAVGLALAIIGLYGVVAFSVAQRRRDVAVHSALGATSFDVLKLVLRREMRLVAIGLAVGLPLAVGEARLLGSLVLGLSPLGAGGIAVISVSLLTVAVIASVVPGLGALRIAPMQVLRQD